jgi:RNA polymerase sigma-70 factor (ECF subfamily)
VQGLEDLDKTLVAQSRMGDQDAMAELVRRHYSTSMRVARSILRNESEAEDAVQTAYSAAFRHLDSFREDARFATWITRIVVNQSIMRLRRLRRANCVSLEELTAERTLTRFLTSHDPNPEDAAGRRETSMVVLRAVGKLPQTLRKAYTLHAVKGLPLDQVAGKLGLTVAAAKTRVFRARTALRTRLQNTGPLTRCA